ncbi:uncharacterized protein LOC107981594 [Nasonia vitripennis]|uniref:DNA/RNA non-specific endonuclease/pyrophosphatase/phosphodiesterase domain-containing protein n=1 Tax=Nasonia vitripennis TaxID=7425 RepID=A0A7M7ITG6_NASVI|nr:uncharacterized protein LOC107981594 [Nasonia vitripennis]
MMTIAGTRRCCLLLLLAFSAADARSIQGARCELSIDYRKGDLKEPQPLILTEAKEPTFLLPEQHRLLLIPANASILLACPGRNNSLLGLPGSAGSQQRARATCLGGKDFLVESEVRSFSNLTCKRLPKETVRKVAGSTCLGRHDKYEIGFAVDRQLFLPLIEICRDASTLRTYYSKYTIPKEIAGYQSQYPRPYWKYGSLYPGYNMNYAFKAEVQLRSMTALLGSEEQARKFIQPGKQYLNRGHLAAKADFVYGAQQTASFWHLNTAAQWASFNSGNWMIAEAAVRNLTSWRQLDLLVYAGVHGVTSLPDVEGVEQPLYLLVNATEKAFPVPRFYWKIIHDPVGNRATAFVGLNEPYASEITEDMYLCPDVSQQEGFSWIGWEPRNIEKGVSYVCSVAELRKSVPTIPALGETGLLL